MTKFKQYLFWATFPILAILVIITAIMSMLFETLENWYDLWEGWCLEYKKNGWQKIDSGLWYRYSKGEKREG